MGEVGLAPSRYDRRPGIPRTRLFSWRCADLHWTDRSTAERGLGGQLEIDQGILGVEESLSRDPAGRLDRFRWSGDYECDSATHYHGPRRERDPSPPHRQNQIQKAGLARRTDCPEVARYQP